MSLNSEHLCLPPLVKGTLNGHLTIKVDDLIWCRQPPGDVYVECRWWGMSNPVVFRPSDVTQREKSQSSSSLLIKDYTVTFDVRTSITMLENYLENCGNLEFIVMKFKSHEKVGTVTVTELKNIVKERMYQRYFPIINSFGNRIGDLHIGFSLWMKSKIDEEKENKLSANDLFDGVVIRKEKKNKGKTLKICKKHLNMLKNAQNKVVSQSKFPSTSQPSKEKPSHAVESCKLQLKDIVHPSAPPNSITSGTDLDNILSRGEKLRNAMFSSLYEDEVFRKTISAEPAIVPGTREAVASTSSIAHQNNKDILLNYLTGAEITSKEKQVAIETLKSVSPPESILFDSLSVQEVELDPVNVEEKVQEKSSEEENIDKNQENAKISKDECLENEIINSAPTSNEESKSQSQNLSNENSNDQSGELSYLKAAFTFVNCCKITVDCLKLASSNTCKNETKDLRLRKCGSNKKLCQQPGAVYFVEYNFSDIKQPLNQQYHTPVRYSSKKQSGPVIHFGQKHIHNLRKPFSLERLKASLQNANWKILRRYLNQRVPSLIGNVFIDNNVDLRLESSLSFPVKSSTGMPVGELFIQLELGKDKGIFGNFLLGEKILAFPGRSMNRACVEIQTESEEFTGPSISRDSLNNWTSSTTGNSRIYVEDHLAKQRVSSNAGKCHQIIIELDELTNYSSLLKSGKDEACYIDYKFPEFEEKTNKVHFSNKFFTTDCVNCSREIRFFFRHSHTLNVSSLSQALLSAAIPGITFSLWTRKFHPGIHDHLVATAFLPTAQLCSLESQFDNQNSVLRETVTLPLTATSAILHKGELHSKSRCSISLTLTYRQMSTSSHGQEINSINSSVEPISTNNEFTSSESTLKKINDSEKDVELDVCTSFERAKNPSQISSSEKIISQLKQIELHKYCVKDSCICRNYHSLFNGEKSLVSKYPVIDNSLVNERPMKNNDYHKKGEVEKIIAIESVKNPAICSILNSQLSEECQQKFVNFILQGNTKLGVVSRCDSPLNGSSELKSKFKSFLSHSYLDNKNDNYKTIQHFHVLQSENAKKIDQMNQPSTGQYVYDTEFISDGNNSPPEHNQHIEPVKELNKVGKFPSVRSLEIINETGENNDELNEWEEDRNKIEDNNSLDFFKVISPPAGFENPPLSSFQSQEHNSEIQERLHIVSTQSPFEYNENRYITSDIGSNSYQQTTFVSQENVLKGEKFYFKPLYCEKQVLSSSSDIFNQNEKQLVGSNYGGQIEMRSSILECDDRNNAPSSSQATQASQEPRSELDSQSSNYNFASQAAECRPQSIYELEMQSGGEDGEDLLSVVTRSVESIRPDSNRSEANHQEHDIDDDLQTKSQKRKVADNHSMESTWVDSTKVSSELRNIMEHLNPTNRDDDQVYDKLLCELKAYVDNVAKEIKSQLDSIEVNLHESHQNPENSAADSLGNEIEEDKDKEMEDISSANAFTINNQNDGYASSTTNNSNPSGSSRINQNYSMGPPPVASPRNSITSLDIGKKRFTTNEFSASLDDFPRSASSAFIKYKSTKHYKRLKMFKAKVEVERGYHLPKVTHPFSQSGLADNPNTFVKLQTSCQSLDDSLFSNLVENSCDPVWMACFDVDLPTELLKQVNITPIDKIANLQFEPKDGSKNETGDSKNTEINVGNTSQKKSRNSIFSSLENTYRNNNKTQCPTVQLTSSLKSKLSELDLLIDALKMKLRKTGPTNLNMGTIERLQSSKSSLSIEELGMNDNPENFDNMQFCDIPKAVTYSSCSNEDREFDDVGDRQPFREDVSRKCTDEEPPENRREDNSPLRTYSIQSYDEESNNKTDASVSDQE